VTYGAGMPQGREAEQRKLDGLLREARAGRSAVLVLRGEPGIGKTALLGYAASRAEGMHVLSAAGVEPEAEIAFAGLYSLLYPLAGQLSALPGRQAAALRAALGLGGPALAAPDWLAVAAGTHGLLTAAAALEPLLVLVDDLHWLDQATAGALAFAVRRLGRDAVACVASTRPGSSVLDGLPVHDLAGLRQPEAALLVEAVAGITPAPAVARRLHAGTVGNPLALTDLAASLTAQQLTGPGPQEVPDLPLQPGAGVQQRYAARLASLDPAVKLTLLVAAAAGTCRAAAIMAAAAQLGGSESLAEAEDARLVRLTADHLEFCHPLVRSVAYHAAPPSQRRAAHHALARALAGGDPERAAWHLAAAATGPDRAAAAALDTAAALAEGKGAPLVAAATWERASELSETSEARTGRVLEEAIAIARYEQLRKLAGDSGLRHPYLSPIPDLIEAYARAGELDRARKLLPEFAAQVPDDDSNPLPAARAERCRGILAGNDFEAHFQHALTLHARGEVVFQHARTHLCYGERLRRARRRRDARAQLRAAIEIFDRLDTRPWTDRAQAELRATGETITDPGQTHQRLTPQELQIALLVAQGQTNAEVGRAIFLSTRTVEFHLSRAYRKLGVATRTELTSRLASAGPAGI
jgi:DNA-binding CsgD family transcriptional regulator